MAKIHGALDFSGPMAFFAVNADGKTIFECSKLMQRRDAASFALFLQSNLKSNNLDFADITHWTVGSGPGYDNYEKKEKAREERKAARNKENGRERRSLK